MIRSLVLLILWAAPVQAHGTLPGGDGFYSGALHPFVATDHLLALVACGLILGRQGLRWPLWALAGGLGAGFGGGLWLGALGPGGQLVLLAVALGLGGALAAPVRLAPWALALGFGTVGLCVGMETEVPKATLAALGLGSAVFLIVMNAFALAALAQSHAAIALRVAGAWIAAVALMVLALALRGLA